MSPDYFLLFKDFSVVSKASAQRSVRVPRDSTVTAEHTTPVSLTYCLPHSQSLPANANTESEAE